MTRRMVQPGQGQGQGQGPVVRGGVRERMEAHGYIGRQLCSKIGGRERRRGRRRMSARTSLSDPPSIENHERMVIVMAMVMVVVGPRGARARARARAMGSYHRPRLTGSMPRRKHLRNTRPMHGRRRRRQRQRVRRSSRPSMRCRGRWRLPGGRGGAVTMGREPRVGQGQEVDNCRHTRDCTSQRPCGAAQIPRGTKAALSPSWSSARSNRTLT